MKLPNIGVDHSPPKDPVLIPCRLLECSNSQRTPVTGEVEYLTADEIGERNKARVTTTQRWYPVPRD